MIVCIVDFSIKASSRGGGKRERVASQIWAVCATTFVFICLLRNALHVFRELSEICAEVVRSSRPQRPGGVGTDAAISARSDMQPARHLRQLASLRWSWLEGTRLRRFQRYRWLYPTLLRRLRRHPRPWNF